MNFTHLIQLLSIIVSVTGLPVPASPDDYLEDLFLPADQLNELLADDGHLDMHYLHKRARLERRGATDIRNGQLRTWPQGRVLYRMECQDARTVANMQQAMRDWAANVPCISFAEAPANAQTYVRYTCQPGGSFASFGTAITQMNVAPTAGIGTAYHVRRIEFV